MDVPPPRLSVCAVGSTSITAVASSRPHGGVCSCHALAPPSVDSAMERCPSFGLESHHHVPAQGSSLALTSIISSLDSVCHPPTGCPSSS